MGATHQIIGNSVCEWSDSEPLKWTMSETSSKGGASHTIVSSFDLSPLIGGYDKRFLLELKSLFIARRKRVALVTIETEFSNLRSLLKEIFDRKLLSTKVTKIDEAFLLSLRTIVAEISSTAAPTLKRLFTANRHSRAFSSDLLPEDFPVSKSKKGPIGELTSRILTRALNRAACVEILRQAEDAYEESRIDIGHFSFIHLAFHIFCRPKSYRELTLSDLQVDIDPITKVKSYFLWVTIPKSRANNPPKVSYQINRMVGELLEMQRIKVSGTYGHLADKENIGALALFPARRLRKDGTWSHTHPKSNHGQTTANTFRSGYLNPIQRLVPLSKISFNALRHTIGTQLAEAGCTAKTIQAVLKHADERACQAYVDIVFNGLIERLSETLEPGFDEHFPVYKAFRSKSDPVDLQKAIRSEDLATGREELTGECGRTIACQYAPLACYACPRFIPCYDADHSINLDTVDLEIAHCKAMGQPFKQMLDRAKDARRHIILVMAASDQKRNALARAGAA